MRGRRPRPLDERGIRTQNFKALQLAYTCTLHFLSEARRKGLNPDWYEFEEGTHNYGLFRRELVASWATLGPALGVSGG